MSKATLNGLIVAAISITIFVAAYLFDKELMLHPMVWWGTFGIYVWFMMSVAKAPSTIDVKSGITAAFTVFVVANMLFYTFYYFLVGHIDPSLQDLQFELMKEQSRAAGLDVPQPVDMTVSQMAFNYVWSLIGGFIVSAIIAFAYNRK